MANPIPSDDYPMYLDADDAARQYASDYTVFMLNRRLTDNPIATITQKTYIDVDPLRGTSTLVPVELFKDIPVDHDHVTEEMVARSAGLVLAQDRVVHTYGLGGELDIRTTFIKLDDAVWYQIITQKYVQDANYTMLTVRPISVKGATLP